MGSLKFLHLSVSFQMSLIGYRTFALGVGVEREIAITARRKGGFDFNNGCIISLFRGICTMFIIPIVIVSTVEKKWTYVHQIQAMEGRRCG